jgi:hypothetical protein
MAAITDLTFAQLNTELGVTAFSLDAPNNDILLSLKALTGDNFTALTNNGVTEVMHKLITGCQEAQATVNSADGIDADEQLRSFPPSTTGAFNPTNLQIPVRHTVEVSLNVDPNNVRGVNV